MAAWLCVPEFLFTSEASNSRIHLPVVVAVVVIQPLSPV